jgi:hypothetical protein
MAERTLETPSLRLECSLTGGFIKMGYKTGVLIFHQPYQQRIKANILKFDPWLAITTKMPGISGLFYFHPP